MRSTQEWEAALEEATPGPWKVLDDHPGEVGTADNRYWIAETYQEEIQYSEGDLKRAQADARLIASVPEAVAEVVRLRRELEQLRDRYLDETSQPHYSGDYGDGRHCATNSAARDIERILEGTHE